MGFRVPMLVLSPFSRGGHVASEVFDHTSQLRFLEERFGVKAPNISAWRRHTAGDLTSTLHPTRSDPSVPKLPSTSKDQMANVLAEGCTRPSILEAAPDSAMPIYPVPAHSRCRRRRRPERATGPAGDGPGTIVVLNGTPRSGKSSLAPALQESSGRRSGSTWASTRSPAATPARLRPGIGLRPGGERPDLEDAVVALFDALYASVVAVEPCGSQVCRRRRPSRRLLQALGHPAQGGRDLQASAGVLHRRPLPGRGDHGPAGCRRRRSGGGHYVTSEPDGSIPDVVCRWERAVHDPGIYDLEVDTSASSAEACAAAIRRRLREGPPAAFAALAARR